MKFGKDSKRELAVRSPYVGKWVKIRKNGGVQYHIILKWIFEKCDWDIDWIFST
jgi:hypothetical protein